MEGSLMRAVITGAARGIGRATSLRLARDAFAAGTRPQFILADLIDSETGEVAEQICQMGGDARVFVTNVAEIGGCEAVVDACVDALGGIDVVVSNAGGGQAGPLAEIPLADWDFAFNLNTRAPLALAQRALPHLRQSQEQVIVASVSGTYPQPNVGAYSASKSAAIMLGHQVTFEWGAFGVRTNIVFPGSYCNGAEIVVDGGFLQTFANQLPVVSREQRV